MSWLRLDDKFPAHPKVLALSDREFRAHVTVLCYCAEYRTDGHVPFAAWRALSVSMRMAERFVTLGLWDRDGDEFSVHDFRAYNPVDPTSAARKARFRAVQGNDEGTTKERKRNGGGTDEERGGNGPHAQAGARVPSLKSKAVKQARTSGPLPAAQDLEKLTPAIRAALSELLGEA